MLDFTRKKNEKAKTFDNDKSKKETKVVTNMEVLEKSTAANN